MPDSLAPKPRMSPEAALVAVILIGSWGLVRLLLGPDIRADRRARRAARMWDLHVTQG